MTPVAPPPPTFYQMGIALEHCSDGEVLALLERGGKFESLEDAVETVIHRSLLDTLRYLVRGGLNPNIPDSQGGSPLYLAALERNDAPLKVLIEESAKLGKECDLHATFNNGVGLYHVAMMGRSLAVARLLDEHGVSAVQATWGNLLPLHTALIHRFDAGVHFLLEKEVVCLQINTWYIDGLSGGDPFGIAAYQEDGEMMKALLRKGAEPARLQPSSIVSQIAAWDVADLAVLVRFGIEVGCDGSPPRSLVQEAIREGRACKKTRLQMYDLAVQLVLIGGRGGLYWSPFHEAVKRGDVEGLTELLRRREFRALTSLQRGPCGVTPLHLAIYQNRREMVPLLATACRASINLQDLREKTPLQLVEIAAYSKGAVEEDERLYYFLKKEGLNYKTRSSLAFVKNKPYLLSKLPQWGPPLSTEVPLLDKRVEELLENE